MEQATALAVEKKKGMPFRTILRFLGPGFLVTVGFIDPGNWATNESCLKALWDEGIDAHSLIKKGEPEAEILREIESGDYDLVAMATHGHSFIGDILFSTAFQRLLPQGRFMASKKIENLK